MKGVEVSLFYKLIKGIPSVLYISELIRNSYIVKKCENILRTKESSKVENKHINDTKEPMECDCPYFVDIEVNNMLAK